MDNQIILEIADKYGWSNIEYNFISSGLINNTAKITAKQGSFILQQINTGVFATPSTIDNNIQLLKQFVQINNPDYLFTNTIETKQKETLICINNNYYRAFNFIENSYTIESVTHESEAYEAATAFANFTNVFSNFNSDSLQDTIPHFHNLELRFSQFEKALKIGNQQKIKEHRIIIDEIYSVENICKKYNALLGSKECKKRVTHHDTKISNVLFKQNKAICVIDLDTVMSGYFISDVGDMFRTYLSPVTEEETNMDAICIRKEVLEAIYQGYMDYMHQHLSKYEKQFFYFAGEVMIYMQAIRFITDFLMNDIYYKTSYYHQNLNRAKNQLTLLKAFQSATNNCHLP